MARLLCILLLGMFPVGVLQAATNAWTFKNNCTNNVSAWWYGWGAGWKQVQTITPGQTISSAQMYAAYGFPDYSANGTWWSDSNGGAPKESGWEGWYNACGDPSNINTNCSTLKLKNLDPVPRWYIVYTNGNCWQVTSLGPGQSAEYTYCHTNGAMQVTAERFALTGDSTDASYTGTNTTNNVPPISGIGQTGSGGQPSGGQYGGSTTNIVWGTNAPDPGTSALLDAVSKFAEQNARNLVGLSNAITGMGSGTVTVTNNVSVTVTNNWAITNSVSVSNYVDNAGVSNAIVSLTNTSGMLGYSNNLWTLAQGGTNWGAGETATEGFITSSGLGASVDTLLGKFELPEISDVGAPAMTMSFCGTEIDLNPVTQFPTVATASWYGFAFVAYLLFGLSVSKLFFETVRMFSSVQTGGVPNLEVEALTFGGNVLGVIVALLVPAVLVLGWCLLMTAVTGHLVGAVLASSYLTNWTSAMGSIGMYLLTTFFPVQIIVSLLVARVTLPVVIGKLVIIGAGATRYLFGK